MSKNFVRILKLAEFLSDAPKNGWSKAEVAERSGLPPSSVYRILTEMELAGYIYKTSKGGLLPNFSFERRIGIGNIAPERLRAACAQISAQLQCASEIILRREHNLLWHLTDEHPNQAIKLRAHPGYVRATYELDSMSRLVLSHCGRAEIEKTWDLAAFYEVGVLGERMDWKSASEKIFSTDKNAMQYDMLGNSKGVRRFCVAVHDAEGDFVCLLTSAEAAVPLRDEEAHVERIRNTLMNARQSLEAAAAEESEVLGSDGALK